MRVTNAGITRDTIAHMQENQRRLVESQVRVASGRRIVKVSDDPVGGSGVMQASGSLRALEQYRRNVEAVGSRLDAEETALDQVTQIATRAKELATGQYGLPATPATRMAAAAEVRQLIEQTVTIGNQRFGEEFLFGGAASASIAPFDAEQTTVDPLYARLAPAPAPAPGPPPAPVAIRPEGRRAVEIGAGQTMAGPHDGDAVFLRTGVLRSLHDLHAALSTNDTAGIETATAGLDVAFANVQALIGDVGVRQNQVGALGAQFDALQMSLEEHRSDLAEVDMERAITEMLGRQSAYQAAMLASSKVMGMSLTDYLR